MAMNDAVSHYFSDYLQWRRNEFESGGGDTSPKQKWGSTDPVQCVKFFLGHVPPLFDSKSTISHFCERFRDGQYSLVSFLFAVLLLTVPPVPSNL